MISYEKFLPEVLQYVPDVPEEVALNAIRNAAVEFCERTRYLQTDLDPIPCVAGVPDYEIVIDGTNKFVDITMAWYNDVLLIPKSTEELNRIYRYTDWRTLKADPQYINREVSEELILVPMPVKTGGNLKIRAAYAPTRASTEIENSVYENFLEYIAYGARARLYNTPKQSYFDKNSAMEFDKRFRACIAEVRTRVNKGLSRSAVSVEYTRFI